MALEACELAASRLPPGAPKTRERLTASMAGCITPQSITMTGKYAKVQLDGVSFANLVAGWTRSGAKTGSRCRTPAFTRGPRSGKSTPP